jgi:hypothetical protein
MPDKSRIHVVPDGDDWKYEREGASRASGKAPTQSQAENEAKELASRTPGGGEVVIHGRDGRIRDSDTIARKDPNPPKDRRH